jgi:chromate transport protein ChrA
MENAPAFSEAFRFWLKLGCISFGGPTGQIAIMHEELVERKQWISDSRFLHALNYCMLLPGPEAQQLATYVGWLLHGTRGGICARVLFVLPSAILLWALSLIYVVFGKLPLIAAIFSGLKPAVVAIVAAAIIRLGKRGLRAPPMWMVAFAAFIAIYVFHLPFPFIILGAAAVGLIGGKIFAGPQPRKGGQFFLIDISIRLMSCFTSRRADACPQFQLTRVAAPMFSRSASQAFVTLVRCLTTVASAIFSALPLGNLRKSSASMPSCANPMATSLPASRSSWLFVIALPQLARAGDSGLFSFSNSASRNCSDPKHQPRLNAFNIPSSMAPPPLSSAARSSNTFR